MALEPRTSGTSNSGHRSFSADSGTIAEPSSPKNAIGTMSVLEVGWDDNYGRTHARLRRSASVPAGQGIAHRGGARFHRNEVRAQKPQCARVSAACRRRGAARGIRGQGLSAKLCHRFRRSGAHRPVRARDVVARRQHQSGLRRSFSVLRRCHRGLRPSTDRMRSHETIVERIPAMRPRSAEGFSDTQRRRTSALSAP